MDCSSEDTQGSNSTKWMYRDPRTLSPLSSPAKDYSALSIVDDESQSSEGMSGFSTPVSNYVNRCGDEALLNAPRKKTRSVPCLRDRTAGDSFTHVGVYGLEYVMDRSF